MSRSPETDAAKTVLAAEKPRPHDEYSERLAMHRSDLEKGRKREAVYSNLRLVAFLSGLVIGWWVFGSRQLGGFWMIPPIVIFIVLIVVHDRVIQQRLRSQRAVEFFEAGLARLEDRWVGRGEGGEAFRDPHHPYAEDLDLFGRGSLFELLCTARTAKGQSILADWLKRAAPIDDVRERQQAVTELAPQLDLREDLALLGDEVRSHVDPDALIRWGSQPERVGSRSTLQIIAALLSSLTAASLTGWFALGWGPIPFLLALVPQTLFAALLRSRIKPLIDAIEAPTRDLSLLRDLLARLEDLEPRAPRLKTLHANLSVEGRPPSKCISQLQRLVDRLDGRRNQFFAPIAALLLWGTQLGLASESWRIRHGGKLGGWIETVAEIEALNALAGYAYENPDAAVPRLLDEGPRLEARALGHPLLPRMECVRNDLELGDPHRAFIVSGSNMSGKSTFLRAVGCNVVLALAGAPVRAEHLELSPFSVAAAIRVNDSLLEGTSQFYAEIKRLRKIVELCDAPRPVLYLLDEILHGTNSHDRKIGATAIVRGLVERDALGLVTTHDLALAEIADDTSGAIANVHFEDHLEDERIVFDYQLRAGIVEKSNALDLMRAIGLEV